MIALYVIGAPGVGKTTFVRTLIGPGAGIITKPKWTVSADGRVLAAGHYTGGTFDGADTVAYNGVGAALDDLAARDHDFVIFDGDRFSYAAAAARVASMATAVRTVHLIASDATLARQRAARGTAQDEKWLRGRMTKVRNFAEVVPGRVREFNVDEPGWEAAARAFALAPADAAEQAASRPVAPTPAPPAPPAPPSPMPPVPQGPKHKVVEALASLLTPVDGLVPDPGNARAHDERSIRAISKSLDKFGQRRPVVVQRDGMIVRAGNGLLAAARKLGWTHVAAIVIDDDETTARAFALADNRTAEVSTWDVERLSAEVMALEDEWDLTDFGWVDDEINALVMQALPDAPAGAAEFAGAGVLPAPAVPDNDTRNKTMLLVYEDEAAYARWLAILGMARYAAAHPGLRLINLAVYDANTTRPLNDASEEA